MKRRSFFGALLGTAAAGVAVVKATDASPAPFVPPSGTEDRWAKYVEQKPLRDYSGDRMLMFTGSVATACPDIYRPRSITTMSRCRYCQRGYDYHDCDPNCAGCGAPL
jgi:hypothetical protein